MALLAAGLLCITSFSACDDDDDNDDKTYAYQLVLELTDAGDIPSEGVTMINQAFKTTVQQFGTQYLTKSDAKKSFESSVANLQTSLGNLVKDNKKTVKITLGFFNSGTQKTEFSHVFEIKPGA